MEPLKNRIPSLSDLETQYALFLSSNPNLIPIKELISCIAFCIYDPRLAELLVVYFSKHWKFYPPFELQIALKENILNTRVAVLLEFSYHLIPNSELKLFQNWAAIVLHNSTPLQGEQFFIGIWQMGSSRALEAAEFSTLEYEKWGYIGRANLCPKSDSLKFSASTRKRILESLLRTHKQISAKEYWDAIGQSVSLRQAERDLRGNKNLSSRGYTRNKRYAI